MATFITSKTCGQANKVVLSRDRRTLIVYKVVPQYKKSANGHVLGKHSDKVIICRYPATEYNKRVVYSNFGRYQID